MLNRVERHLSPAEAARRLGVSIKALRLYEQHGLVAPLRSTAGWRTYGPDDMARLHQVLALRRLGLPLARIASLVRGRCIGLDSVLALQQQALAREAGRISRALSVVRRARRRLARGDTLSIDDLATLIMETKMTKPTAEDMKAIFEPAFQKYFTPEERQILATRPYNQEELSALWDALIAEAEGLMAEGDPSSPAALDLARRWKAMAEKFTGGEARIAGKLRAVWREAIADPEAARKLPINLEIFAFIAKATARLKGSE